jgi:hypothetical protein
VILNLFLSEVHIAKLPCVAGTPRVAKVAFVVISRNGTNFIEKSNGFLSTYPTEKKKIWNVYK